MKKSIHGPHQQCFQVLLRQVRKEAKLTQPQLADRLATVTSRISDYERGERRMDLVQLRQYCLAMDTTLREFVDRFEDML